jgi:uncharacterized damage-inducible protein DinB
VTIPRPADTEFAPFYAGYVDQVAAAGGPVPMLEAQAQVFEHLAAQPENIGDHCYAEGKWSVKELVGHMADTERVFAYRLLRIARHDPTPLSGFDENAWAASAPHARRALEDVSAEMIAVRAATMPLIYSLDATTLAMAGTANGKSITARALCWILTGHAEHHLGILRTRYGVKI